MLTDLHARQFSYLRLSVTEACNFRCSYCLPNGMDTAQRENELSVDEIAQLVSGFAALGTRKVRITGGEPSLRKDLCDIIATCKATPGIEQVALTSNGYLLNKQIAAWQCAGLDAINISIDSFDAATFARITGHDKLGDILAGIDQAIALGMRSIKVNAVLLKSEDDHYLTRFLDVVRNKAITIRFIELMETGDNGRFFTTHHLSGAVLRQQLLAQGWQVLPKAAHAGPADEFMHPDYLGRIGLITPYEKDFCASCNRLRVSSEGKLFLCLFAEQHHDLRHLLSSAQSPALQAHLQNLLGYKLAGHDLASHDTGATRHFAMIGG